MIVNIAQMSPAVARDVTVRVTVRTAMCHVGPVAEKILLDAVSFLLLSDILRLRTRLKHSQSGSTLCSITFRDMQVHY